MTAQLSPQELQALASDPSVGHREVSLLTSFWIMHGFTVPVLIARFYARISRRSLGPDDWTMLAAWVLYTTALGISTALVAKGSFRHLPVIPQDELIWILKVMNIDQPFGAWAAALGKTSVALLLMRIMERTPKGWRNIFLWVNIIIYILSTIVTTVLIFTQCSPPRALWEINLIAEGRASCPRTNVNTKMTIFQSSFGVWMDFMLAVFPITFIYKLNISLQKKLGVWFLLSLGIFAGICAIVKTIQFTNGFGSPDPTYNTYSVFLWSSLELPFIIIAGSIPPVKPVFDMLRGKSIKQGPSFGKGSAGSSSNGSWFRRRLITGSRGSRLPSQDSHLASSKHNTRDEVPSSNGSRDQIMVEKSVTVERNSNVESSSMDDPDHIRGPSIV